MCPRQSAVAGVWVLLSNHACRKTPIRQVGCCRSGFISSLSVYSFRAGSCSTKLGPHLHHQGRQSPGFLWHYPAKVDDALIALLRNQEALVQAEPDRLYKPGERVRITSAPFIDIWGIFQMTDADQRVMVLIELMSKPVKIYLAPSELQKVG
jgi:hypothetical protein